MDLIKQTFQRCKAHKRVCWRGLLATGQSFVLKVLLLTKPLFYSLPWLHMSRPDTLLLSPHRASSWACRRAEQVCLSTVLGALQQLTAVLDIIELGVPFTDPIADGPTIQTSNTV